MEKIICPKTTPESKMQSVYCPVKYLNLTHVSVDLHANITEPVYDIWMHTVFYYKFNGITYSKFPIDLWENGCDYLAGKSKNSYILDWVLPNYLKYTNWNHTCPYVGLVFCKVASIHGKTLQFKYLIPAGRYYVDFVITDGERAPMAKIQAFFSVSDHRLEKV